MKHKYLIGTRIKYKGCALLDVGKKGTIVGYISGNRVWIVVPGSFVAKSTYGDSGHKWTTDIESLEVLALKNQQLLFDFMNEE